jgi:subtilisin family serine protease
MSLGNGQILEATIRLNQIVYAPKSSLSAAVRANSRSISREDLRLFVVAPDGKDVEVITLKASIEPDLYTSATSLPIELVSDTTHVKQLDGKLTLKPNELFLVMLILREKGKDIIKSKLVAAAFGLMEDANFQGAPVEINSEIAMTEDERKIPPGGKQIGTIASKTGPPVQLPIDELIIYPSNDKQLDEFLKETDGKILMDNKIANKDNEVQTSFLVQVNTLKTDVKHLPQIRALFGEKEKLIASSEKVLQIYSLAMELWLKGFITGVNPRLQFMDSPPPRTSDGAPFLFEPAGGSGLPTPAPPFDAMSTSPPPANIKIFADPNNLLKVRQAWAFLALWDKDTARIPVAFIDMGFAPNWDFRGFSPIAAASTIFERDVHSRATGVGSATGPPTVGDSFFGKKEWHGTGVVTTAAGVLNNGWGAAGTGGQVVVPMLYQVGLFSYAFEMGNGIIQAVNDGAAIINISAGYPCKLLSNVHVEFRICCPGGRIALCTTLRTLLQPAADLLLLIPFVGLGARIEVEIAADTAFAACLLTILAGDVRGPMEQGVQFAANNGVTVVSIAGNKQDRSTIGHLCDIIPCGEQDVSDWEVIPGVIPGVICVGAADPEAAYKNQEFFGNRVDIWAPINSTYFHPPTTNAVGNVANQLRKDGFSGTSAAAPYITGIIAMMMAVNPTLNPRTPGLTPRQLASIPGRIRTLLSNTATLAAVVNNVMSAEIAALSLASDPNIVRRQNLVNAFAAVKAASVGLIPNTDAMQYDTSLGLVSPGQGDEPLNPIIVHALDGADEISKTILTIPAENSSSPGVTYSNQQWYQWNTPDELGIYGDGRIRLTLPIAATFGNISLRVNDRDLSRLSTSFSGVEEVREYTIPQTFHHQNVLIQATGTQGSDNVYKIKFFAGRRVSDLPHPDRFDRPEDNPPDRPNNNTWDRAVQLGVGELSWEELTDPNLSIPGIRVAQIHIPDLNFHQQDDQDWFLLNSPVDAPTQTCPECAPYINIVTEGADCIINIYGFDDNILQPPRWTGVGSVRLRCNRFIGHFPLRIQVLFNPNQPSIYYNLRVRWIRDIPDSICNESELMEVGSAEDIIDRRCLQCDMKFYDPTDDLFEKAETNEIDSAGRVTKPQFYSINWHVKQAFNLKCTIQKGQPLAIRLISHTGKIMAQAATSDLLELEEFKQAVAPIENVDVSTLYLRVSDLAEGLYFISISYGLPDTVFRLELLRKMDGSFDLNK